MLLRHVLAILALPFTVTVLVPAWLATRAPPWPVGPVLVFVSVDAAVIIGGAGLALVILTIRFFAGIGRGTLAPWDPTRRLVVVGPYRHVRNPMISAVATMLTGEALYFLSVRIAMWVLLFAAINHAYFLLLEEPGLVHRFGEEYERYRAAVPRWLPRRRGWP